MIELAIQINGKTQSTINIPSDNEKSKDEILEQARAGVSKYFSEGEIIFVR